MHLEYWCRFKKRIMNDDIKDILVLAFPAMIENILQVLLGMIDMILIAQLGTEAVAGVGATNLLMNIYIAIFTTLGVGTTAIVSQSIGAKLKRVAEIAAEQSVYLACVVGLIIGGISLFFGQGILEVLGAAKEVVTYGLPYFLAVAVPSIFLVLMLVMSSALRGAGDTKTPMKVTLIINIVNIFLDYILIFGLMGFNGLGVLGAGLATSISRMIGVGLLFYYLTGKRGPLDGFFKHGITFERNTLKTILRVGLPATLERLVMRLGQLLYSAMILKIGTDAYAAHNIAGSIESLSYMPGYGFAIAAATLVGQNLGAKDAEKAKRLGLLSNWVGTVVMMIIGAGFFAFARPLGRLYTGSEQVLDQVVMVLRIIALVQPVLCITLVITAALQGAGDTKFPMYSTLFGIWGVRVLGVYILGLKFGLGLKGVWIAVALDLILRGILLFLRFLWGGWSKIQLSNANEVS